MNIIPLLLVLTFSSFHLFGVIVTGNIYNLIEKEPLVGVTIVKENAEISSSGFEGEFIIEIKNHINQFVFKFPGFYDLVAHNINLNCDTLKMGIIYMFGPTKTFHPPKNGIEKYHYKNGVLKEEVPFKNYKIHGNYRYYSREKQLILKIRFRKGRLTGDWRMMEDIIFKIDEKNQCLRLDLKEKNTNCL